jgi:hypothetical protein
LEQSITQAYVSRTPLSVKPNTFCPDGGLPWIKAHLSAGMLLATTNEQISTEVIELSDAASDDDGTILRSSINPLDFPSAGDGILIKGNESLVAPYTMYGSVRNDQAHETLAIGIHRATVTLQQRLNRQCGENINTLTTKKSGQYQYFDTQTSSVQTRVPAIRVVCGRGQWLLGFEKKYR